MLKSNKVSLILLALSGISLFAGTYSLIINEADLEGEASLSHISIEINQNIDDNNTSGQIAVPGTTFSQKTEVNNTGKKCYLRFEVSPKSDYSLDSTSLNNIDASKWIAKNGVYYLKEPLNSKEKITLFDGITIPATLTNDSSGKDIGFNLKVDAIQADNFDVDFDSDTPWGDVSIKEYDSEVKIGG